MAAPGPPRPSELRQDLGRFDAFYLSRQDVPSEWSLKSLRDHLVRMETLNLLALNREGQRALIEILSDAITEIQVLDIQVAELTSIWAECQDRLRAAELALAHGL